jgi:hypothetical protein
LKRRDIFRNALIDELAKGRNTYADNLRRQPALKWAVLGGMCSYPNKERYPLKIWSEAVSFLLGCPISFENYAQIESSLKPFCMKVR